MVNAYEAPQAVSEPLVNATSDEAWEVDFDHAQDQQPAKRRLSDHERWVLQHLIHEGPAR